MAVVMPSRGRRKKGWLYGSGSPVLREGLRAEQDGLEQMQELSRRNLTTLNVTGHQGHYLPALGAELARLKKREQGREGEAQWGQGILMERS